MRYRCYKKDKCGIAWVYLREKLQEWAEQLGGEYLGFKCSSGFIQKCFQRHNIVPLRLHGEGGDMTKEDMEEEISELRRQLRVLILKHSIKPACVYNTDQIGLFYAKLPNSVYAVKSNAKTMSGVKSMKAKERVSLMVCVASYGSKTPLCVVRNPRTPRCFRHTSPLPCHYTHQTNAWFNGNVFLEWVHKVFWPHRTNR